MQTLFGLPLFGSLFTPILITIVSVLLFRTFFRISKVEISNEPLNIEPVGIKDSLESGDIKTPVKEKKKKSCGGKKGGKGCCSDKNGIIDITKVFVEGSSLSKVLVAAMLHWKKKKKKIVVIKISVSALRRYFFCAHNFEVLCGKILIIISF